LTDLHQHSSETSGIQSAGWLNLSLIALLWIVFCLQLSFEWSVNDQYSYGLFVPFITVYLLHLRWLDRPEPGPILCPTWLAVGVLGCIVIFHFPLRIVFEANTDWRLIIWLQALLLCIATALIIYRLGGRPWLQHFIIPFALLLTAVPWPVFLEKVFVQGLMAIVATMTVEIVNFLGIHARQAGNIIYLSNGVVSVEEACSGIRSFQSTIMSGIMLGELLRFSGRMRSLLVIVAALLALFFNFCRTLLLTWLSATRGIDVMQNWHDSAGLFVFLASFASLVILAYWWNRMFANRPLQDTLRRRARSAFTTRQPLHPLPTSCMIPLLLLLLATEPAVHYWYIMRPVHQPEPMQWDIDWRVAGADLEHKPISPQIKDVLHYSRGEFVSWQSDPALHWLAYFFTWENGKSAQLGGVHNPEICLPATGWTLREKAADFVWRRDGLQLVFNRYHFQNHSTAIYVFYCQWDPAGYPYHTKAGRYRRDRLYDAWVGDRKDGKQKLEIIIQGAANMEFAQGALTEFLNHAVRLNN